MPHACWWPDIFLSNVILNADIQSFPFIKRGKVSHLFIKKPNKQIRNGFFYLFFYVFQHIIGRIHCILSTCTSNVGRFEKISPIRCGDVYFLSYLCPVIIFRYVFFRQNLESLFCSVRIVSRDNLYGKWVFMRDVGYMHISLLIFS